MKPMKTFTDRETGMMVRIIPIVWGACIFIVTSGGDVFAFTHSFPPALFLFLTVTSGVELYRFIRPRQTLGMRE